MQPRTSNLGLASPIITKRLVKPQSLVFPELVEMQAQTEQKIMTPHPPSSTKKNLMRGSEKLETQVEQDHERHKYRPRPPVATHKSSTRVRVFKLSDLYGKMKSLESQHNRSPNSKQRTQAQEQQESVDRSEQQRRAMDTQFSKFVLKPKPGELRLSTDMRGYSPQFREQQHMLDKVFSEPRLLTFDRRKEGNSPQPAYEKQIYSNGQTPSGIRIRHLRPVPPTSLVSEFTRGRRDMKKSSSDVRLPGRKVSTETDYYSIFPPRKESKDRQEGFTQFEQKENDLRAQSEEQLRKKVKRRKQRAVMRAAANLKRQIAHYNKKYPTQDNVDYEMPQTLPNEQTPFHQTQKVLTLATSTGMFSKRKESKERFPTLASLSRRPTAGKLSRKESGLKRGAAESLQFMKQTSVVTGSSELEIPISERKKKSSARYETQGESRQLTELSEMTESISTQQQLEEIDRLKHYGKFKIDQMIARANEKPSEVKKEEEKPNYVKSNMRIQISPVMDSERKSTEPQVRVTLQKKRKFIRSLIDATKWMKEMKISPSQLYEQKMLPQQSYQRRGARRLINAAKHGDIYSVEECISDNSLLVYEYDNVQQTALHWAAKRNFVSIIKLLVKHGANVNAFDMARRTPLFIASKCGNVGATKALLEAKANPFYESNCRYSPIDVAKKPRIYNLLKTARTLHAYLKCLRPGQREKEWTDNVCKYFITDIEEERIPDQYPEFKPEISSEDERDDQIDHIKKVTSLVQQLNEMDTTQDRPDEVSILIPESPSIYIE